MIKYSNFISYVSTHLLFHSLSLSYWNVNMFQCIPLHFDYFTGIICALESSNCVCDCVT